MAGETKYFIVIQYSGGGGTDNVRAGYDSVPTSAAEMNNTAARNGAGAWSSTLNSHICFYTYTKRPLLAKLSTTDSGFTAGHPFASGAAKEYTVQAGDALTPGTTYYWRVRSKDPLSSNTNGSWSSTRSFLVGYTAALTGTITPTATEADIVAGGKTLIMTLTGDTWIAAGAASFDLQRDEIIAGITSAQSETLGWNLVPKLLQSLSGVVRTSNTVVTVTWDTFVTYNITATETITVTIPSTAVISTTSAVATPTFSVTATSNARIKDVIGNIIPSAR